MTRDAIKALAGITEPKKYRQVANKIFDLLANPLPNDSQELHGYNGRRVDIGEFRIIYSIDEPQELLKIILVGKRNDDEVYKDLKR